MDKVEFKKIVKAAVKEALKEELREILSEVAKSSKQSIKENTFSRRGNETTIKMNSSDVPVGDIRSRYLSMISQTADESKNTSYNGNFVPPADPVNGNLGSGEISLDEIMRLVKQ